MMLRSKLPALAAACLTLALVACSVSTAHLGDIQLGKDEKVTQPTTNFDPHDTVYARIPVSNVPNKVTVQVQTVAVSVKGAPAGPISALDYNQDMPSDGTVDYKISTSAPAGLPVGTYKIVATMMDNGTQRDQKSQEFTVGAASDSSAASSSSAPADTSAPAASPESSPQ